MTERNTTTESTTTTRSRTRVLAAAAIVTAAALGVGVLTLGSGGSDSRDGRSDSSDRAATVVVEQPATVPGPAESAGAVGVRRRRADRPHLVEPRVRRGAGAVRPADRLAVGPADRHAGGPAERRDLAGAVVGSDDPPGR